MMVAPDDPEADLDEPKVSDARVFQKLTKKDIGAVARFLIEDPLYLQDVQLRLRRGTLHPMLQVALMNYAYGKPKERVEVRHAAVVKIIHEFIEEPKVVAGVAIPEVPSGQ